MVLPQPDRSSDVQVQRLRVRYAKRGRVRFVSHRGFQRALERVLRRAAVPVAFSAGCTPHRRISYAGGAPTGQRARRSTWSSVSPRQDPAVLRIALDESLLVAPGCVLAVVEPADGAPSLPELLQASVWEMAFAQVGVDGLSAVVAAFLAADVVEVERTTKEEYPQVRHPAGGAQGSRSCSVGGFLHQPRGPLCDTVHSGQVRYTCCAS